MISVIIPAHNAEHAIATCLTSLQAQTFRDFECIVVDDHSTDATGAIVQRMVADDARFRMVRTARNRGPSHCRNLAMEMASRTYIGFLDADDWLEPDALQKLWRFTDDHALDYCFSSHLEYLDQARCYRKRNAGLSGTRIYRDQEIFRYVEQYLADPCAHYGLVHCWGRLYRRDVIVDHALQFDVRLFQMEDVSFNFNYLLHCNTCGYIDEYVYVHRIPVSNNLGSMKGAQAGFDRKLMQAIKPVENYLRQKMSLDASSARQKILHLYASMVIVTIIRGSRRLFAHPSLTIYRSLQRLVGSPMVRHAIGFYAPGPTESRFIGLAIRWRLTSLAVTICLLKRVFRVTL